LHRVHLIKKQFPVTFPVELMRSVRQGIERTERATQFALRGSSDCPRKPATEATGLDFQSEFVDCRRLVRANQQLVVMLIAYTRYSG
jgi:hypothetical protein